VSTPPDPEQRRSGSAPAGDDERRRVSPGGRTPNWADLDDPRIPDRPIWCNGRIRRGADAALSVFDRGARDGLGLIETLRVERRRPLEWHGHIERLVLASAEIGYPVPPPPDLLARAVAELLDAAGLDDAAIRITVTRGGEGLRPGRPGCWIDAQPLAARLWRGTRSGEATAIFSRRPFAPGPWGRYKTTSRMAYQQASDEARIARADEAILVSADGEVLEGAASSVFAVIGGRVATPSLETGILPGVTRATVLALCRELDVLGGPGLLHRDALLRAEEVFLTNALQQIVPLARIGEREIPGRALGWRLLDLYRARVGATP
jgi:branched-subunit amino acid aminotransferase/4-amino-4-deoxychorismate lyase